jgi:hypothetical protein
MSKDLLGKRDNSTSFKSDRKIKIWLVSVLFSIGIVWTLPIPFGGSPDEPTYLEYGLFQTQVITGDTVNKSTYLNITKSSCFAFKIDIPANCQKFEVGTEVMRLSDTALINYPKPWFYLTSWPALFLTGELALTATKFLSFLLSLSMLLIPIYYWKNDVRKLLISIAFGVTPLALSMIGAYNPNNLEIFSSIGIALMLFGKSTQQKKQNESRSYWAWLFIMVFLASTAKPLSGAFVFGVFSLYGLYLYRIRKIERQFPESAFEKRELKILGGIGILSLPITLFFSWPSISQADTIPVGQAEVNNLYTLLNFLIRSYDYFIEHAGLFGWRDLAPAPWMLLVWLVLIFQIFNKIAKETSRIDRSIIAGLWLIVIFIAPAFQSLLLAHQYNVGLQTRYLSGLFGAFSIYTVAFLGETSLRFAINSIRLWAVLALINGTWLFIRHSFGITPALTSGPHIIVDQIRTSVNWIPGTWPLVLLVLIVLVYLLKTQPKQFRNI